MLSSAAVPQSGENGLRNSPTVKRINRFLTSPYYIMTVALLLLLSNILSAELIVYTVLVAFFAYACLFGDDLLPTIPVLCGCYIAPSVSNNPGRSGESVFSTGNGGLYILGLGAIAALSVLYRLITDKELGRKAFILKKRPLLSGILMLCGGYLLSGILSPAYPEMISKNLIFAALQCVSILIPYLVISGTVHWDKVRKDYLAWTGLAFGCVIVLQILWIYASTSEILLYGVIDRNKIYTGWGMYNNMGGFLAMMMPFPFYIARKYRHGWIGICIATVFMGGIFLTCSRSSILGGAMVYALCLLLMTYHANNKKLTILLLAGFAIAGVAVGIVFHKKIAQLFWDIISRGLDPNHRFTFYIEGIKQFLQYPLFGGSFYPIDYPIWSWSKVASFTEFFPPRWHNTLVQLMASTGLVGLMGYLIHRFQSLRTFFRNITTEKTYIGLSVLALLFCSLLDCHFFNIGPVLFYSVCLAFAENLTQPE